MPHKQAKGPLPGRWGRRVCRGEEGTGRPHVQQTKPCVLLFKKEICPNTTGRNNVLRNYMNISVKCCFSSFLSSHLLCSSSRLPPPLHVYFGASSFLPLFNVCVHPHPFSPPSIFFPSFSVKDVPALRVAVSPLSSSADLSPLYGWGRRLSPQRLTSWRWVIHVCGCSVHSKHWFMMSESSTFSASGCSPGQTPVTLTAALPHTPHHLLLFLYPTALFFGPPPIPSGCRLQACLQFSVLNCIFSYSTPDCDLKDAWRRLLWRESD